jgi:hypothetical protein
LTPWWRAGHPDARKMVESFTTTTLSCLTRLAPSVDVRRRPPLSVAVVTHLVTRFTDE